jgi:predicted amidohydrolase YtcJ
MSSFVKGTAATVLAVLALVVASYAQRTVQVPEELVSYPDLILHNGKIVTVDDYSLGNSLGRTVQAVAIRGDRIQTLGSNDQILRLAGPQTRRIDLKGRTAVPGLIDTHQHLHDAAVEYWAEDNPQEIERVRKQFSVTGRNFDEITRGIELVVKEQMAHPEPGQWAWIELPVNGSGIGIGADYLINKAMNREQLDQLAPRLPVFVGAHPAFLWNSAARNDFLTMYEVEPTDDNEKKAITISTTIGRSLIADRYFDTHLSELADIIAEHLTYPPAGGFTTFSSHIVGLRKMPAYMKLVREGRMPMRFAFSHRFCQQVEPDIPGCFLRAGDWAGLGDRYFWNVGLTLGGIDSGPPAICTSYEASAEDKAKEDCILQPGNSYWRAIYSSIRARYRYVVNHLYGDKPLDYVMDIMEQVMKDNPDISLEQMKALRLSADHCGFYPRKEQLPRMQRLGIMISCGAGTLTRSYPYLKVYGEDKASNISPIKSSLSAGVMTTLEVEGLDFRQARVPPPYMGAKALITRRNRQGMAVAPDQAIDRETLLKMSTVWAAHFVLKEKELGTLEPGKFADVVVFNKDYLTVPVDEIGTVYPVMTVLGGKIAVLREEFGRELGMAPVGRQVNYVFTEGTDD